MNWAWKVLEDANLTLEVQEKLGTPGGSFGSIPHWGNKAFRQSLNNDVHRTTYCLAERGVRPGGDHWTKSCTGIAQFI